MDDSHANNDNRMERPKNRAQEQAQRKQEEYNDLIRLLKERVEEMNANSGNVPKFVVRGSSIQLDHIVLHLEFDQLFMSPADYVLVLKVGLAPFKKPLFGSEPPPVKHKLQPAASDDPSSIVWVDKVGNLGYFTSAELVGFALDLLTAYHLQHKRN